MTAEPVTAAKARRALGHDLENRCGRFGADGRGASAGRPSSPWGRPSGSALMKGPDPGGRFGQDPLDAHLDLEADYPARAPASRPDYAEGVRGLLWKSANPKFGGKPMTRDGDQRPGTRRKKRSSEAMLKDDGRRTEGHGHESSTRWGRARRRCRSRSSMRKDHLNGHNGSCHGGAIFTLADSAHSPLPATAYNTR